LCHIDSIWRRFFEAFTTFFGKEVKRCPAWGVSESARMVLKEGTGMSSPHFFTNNYKTTQIYNKCLHLNADSYKQSGKNGCKSKKGDS
jgi:hypothetical protein